MAFEFDVSSSAAAHLEPYDSRISENFEIPVHIGRSIAQWSAPEFVFADSASHMRAHDYVVGFVHKDQAVAFPLWITDYYHVVNCEIEGDPVMFTTCERCQSGAAFHSVIEGKQVNFSAMGMTNASLTLRERTGLIDRQGSDWLHYEGVCVNGRYQGTFLSAIPTFHMTWEEWCRQHPQTTVMLEPDNLHHADARHGHGREEYFSRPGMDPPLIQTITGDLDDRYPENEMVLGVNTDGVLKAWPLREVKRSGGVVHERFGDSSLVIFAGPAPECVAMAAYSTVVDGEELTFETLSDCFRDLQTGSQWTIEGRAVSGPFIGKQLQPVRWNYVRWHAWCYPHRATELYLYAGKLRMWPVSLGLNYQAMFPLLNALRESGRQVVVDREVYNLSLPHESLCGLVLNIDEDRLNLYEFATTEAAQDYVNFNGAWFCPPLGLKVGKKLSRRIGRFVLESDPPVQFEGPSQFVRLPDPQIQWSELLQDTAMFSQLKNSHDDDSFNSCISYTGLFRHLKKQGFDVIETAFLPHSQLRVGTVNAMAATINADRFAIYKCRNFGVAERIVQEVGHAVRVGRWVIRSTPVIMFQDPCYEMVQLPDEESRWSTLLDQNRFLQQLRAYLPGDETFSAVA